MSASDTPPFNLDAERSVLGAALLDDRHVSVAIQERLKPDDFYYASHGAVFAVMVRLHISGRKIDVLTVSAALAEEGKLEEVGGSPAVDELAGWVPASGHAREYAKIVRDHAVRRQLIEAAFTIENEARSGTGSIRDLLEQAERRMLSISDVSAGDLARLTADEERERLKGVRDGNVEVGVPSGFADLDKLIAGFQPDALYVLAARPSMGKSALVTNFAENVAAKGHAVALFSLEMGRGEILRRLIASRGRVSGDALLRGPIPDGDWARVEKAIDDVLGWPLFVDESGDVSVMDIRAKARRLHAKIPLGMIIVDYVQLMRSDERQESRTIEVGRMTRGLKVLAKELNVPVLAVSQLSRAVEQRHDKRPMLSDLRDSGSIEQDSDLVMFLFRESYYDPEVEDPAVTELNIAKHRNGPVGKLKLTFLDRYPKFNGFVEDRWTEPLPVDTVSSDGNVMPF